MELAELIKTNRSTEQMLQDIGLVQSSDDMCDILFYCNDGTIHASSLIFGTISPMIYKALHQTPQVENTWSVVLPETSKCEMEQLIWCLFRTPSSAETFNKILPVMKRLNIVHVAHTKQQPNHAGLVDNLRSLNGHLNEHPEVSIVKSEGENSVLENYVCYLHKIKNEHPDVCNIESENKNSALKDDISYQRNTNNLNCHKQKIRKIKKEICKEACPQESQNIKTKKIKVEEKQQVKCEVCDKFLKKASGLSTHMKFHKLGYASVGKDSPTGCKECGKIFKTKQEHRQHFTRVHIGARTKQCPMIGCNKSFKSNGEVKAHMRTHTNNKEFMCSDCGANFSTKHSLANHTLRKHTVGYNEQHHCDECGSIFRMLTDLKSHIHNVHRANEIRRHVCVECGKGFSHKYSLKKHMMIHTDERPIECRICRMRFRTNSNYNKHAKTHLKNTFNKMMYKPEGVRIVPDVELSVQQLPTGDAPLQLQIAKPGDAPLQLHLANVPVMSVRAIQSIAPHEEDQLRHIASGLLPAGYIV